VYRYQAYMWHRIHHWFRRKKVDGHWVTPEAYSLGDLLRSYGWNVEFEKWDGYKHIDIAITECKVNIEVDGGQHTWNVQQALADLERTYYSFKKGFVTLRIPNVLVHNKETTQLTARFIDKFLRTSEQQLENK
jgi:very-short-patch-repair endonuclease